MLTKILIFFCFLCLANAEICEKLLHQLADHQAKYLYCVTIKSVPVTMCNGCKNQYDDLIHFYDEFYQSCNATYFDQDRINLVPSTEALLTGLWTKAYCDDCFNNNNSRKFNDLYTPFKTCAENNPKRQCDECKNEYKELNDFYLSLDQHNDGEVCFDIQDSMNRTRNTWSKKYQCCLRQYNVFYFSIALSITLGITLMFYCSTYLLSKRQERNHGILNDEDPLFNSPSSSIATVAQLNISNNETQTNRLTPVTTVNESNNIPRSTSEMCKKNKVSKTYEEIEESSDDEPLVKGSSSSMVKEKLK